MSQVIEFERADTRISLAALRQVRSGPVRVELGPSARRATQAAHATVSDVVASGRVVYGINTGFGQLAQTVIPRDRLAALQMNLVRSHAAGVGPPLSDEVVRLTLLLKVLGFSRGRSGVSLGLVEALMSLLEHEVYPVVPAKGSVGASGDLAPLAHVAGVLIGEGEVRHRGRTLAARDGLRLAGLEPLVLGPKEGLALLNGTQVSTALALAALFAIEDGFGAAVVAGALTVDAVVGSDVPFDERVQAVRGQPGQTAVAAAYRALLAGSEIRESHRECPRVQDPYSVRCQPQVMGACLDLMTSAGATLEVEVNAVTDNPLVFPETGEVLSGGNFHAEPVAMAADLLAIAVAEVGAIAERRIALLMDEHLSGLPPFLTADSGFNSGFMIAQITAAALASENKSLAHPASVDSLPTSANQEDHVSMATFAARRLHEMAENTSGIVAIELLAATRGVEFRAPLQTAEPLRRAMSVLRERVAAPAGDQPLSGAIATVSGLIHAGRWRGFVRTLSLPSGRADSDG